MKALTFLAVLAVGLAGDEAEVLIAQATTAYQSGERAEAARLFEDAVKAGAKGARVSYSLACCYAWLGRTDDAFAAIDKALDAGWRGRRISSR